MTAAALRYDRRGSGRPLVLLHGFTASALDMAPLAAAFAGEFEVLSPDLPGHGGSSIAPGYRFDDAVADLLATLEAAGHRRACWLGYSLGARLALACAARLPACAEALLLIGGRAGIADAAERESRRQADEALAARIERDGIQAFVDEWLEQPLFATQHALGPAFLEAARRRRLANDPRRLAASLRALGPGAQPPLFDLLGRVAAPTLLVFGSLDRKFAAAADELAAGLPRAERCEIAGAGHAAHLERPDEFIHAAREFLRAVASPARADHPAPVEETAS